MPDGGEKDLQSLDEEIVKLSKSTRTTVPALLPLHDVLRHRFRWYYNWSLFKYSKLVHVLFLIGFLIFLGSVFYGLGFSNPQFTKADTTPAIIPNAAGDLSNLGVVNCVNHYDCVSVASDGKLVRVTGGSGGTDLYNLPNQSLTGSISMVSVYVLAMTATTGGANPHIKDNGIERAGTGHSLDGLGWTWVSNGWSTNALGASWTWTDIDNLQIGVELGSDVGGTTSADQVYATVTYLLPPAAPTAVYVSNGATTSQLTVNWTKSSGATKYYISSQTSCIGAWSGETEFLDVATGNMGSLAANTSYCFRVRAWNGSYSGYSNTGRGQTLATKLLPSTALGPSSGGGAQTFRMQGTNIGDTVNRGPTADYAAGSSAGTFSRTDDATHTASYTTDSGNLNTVENTGDVRIEKVSTTGIAQDPGGAVRIEEARQNSLLYSSFEAGSNPPTGWTNALLTSTTAATGIHGTNYANLVTNGAGYNALYQAVSGGLTSGTTYTLSIYAQYVSGYNGNFSIGVEGACGSYWGTGNTVASGSWQRITKTFAVTTTGACTAYIEPTYGTASAATFMVDAVQLEAGGFATSYIPTTTAALTRNGENVQYANTSNLATGSGSVSMWVKPEWNSTDTNNWRGTDYYGGLFDSGYYTTGANALLFAFWTQNNTANNDLCVWQNGNGNGCFAPTFTANTWHHVVLTYQTGQKPLVYWDGVLSITSSLNSNNVPTTGNFTIGKTGWANPNSYFDGLISDFTIFNTALDANGARAVYSGYGPTAGVQSPTSTTAMSVPYTSNSSNQTGYYVDRGTAGQTTCSSATYGADVASASSPFGDTGLAANSAYCYQVKAYLTGGTTSAVGNVTASAKYTLIEAISGITYSGITTTSITIAPTNTPSNLAVGTSGIQLKNTTNNTCQDGAACTAFQQSTAAWQSSGLSVNTVYGFSIQSRNADGVVTTAFTGNKYTLANPPIAPTLYASDTATIHVIVNANSNPNGTKYRIQYSTDNSTWSSCGADWTARNNQDDVACGSLTNNQGYYFRMTAQNGDATNTTDSSVRYAAPKTTKLTPSATLQSYIDTNGMRLQSASSDLRGDSSEVATFARGDTNATFTDDNGKLVTATGSTDPRTEKVSTTDISQNPGRAVRIEEARTNSIINSTFETDVNGAFPANWVDQTNGLANVTNTASIHGSKSVIVKRSGADWPRIYNAISGTTGTTYTLSGWVKTTASNLAYLQIQLNGGDYTWKTYNSAYAPNDGQWHYLSVTTDQLTSNTTVFYYLYNQSETTNAYFDAVQLEVGTFATSYIPTTTATATRNAEFLNYSPTNNINQDEGSISFWAKPDASTNLYPANAAFGFAAYYVNTNNQIKVAIDGSGNVIGFQRIGGAGAVSSSFSAGKVLDTNWHHIALTWSKTANQLKIYVDGVGADNIGTFSGTWGGTFDNLNLWGVNGGAWNNSDALISNWTIFNTALTAAQARAVYSGYGPTVTGGTADSSSQITWSVTNNDSNGTGTGYQHKQTGTCTNGDSGYSAAANPDTGLSAALQYCFQAQRTLTGGSSSLYNVSSTAVTTPPNNPGAPTVNVNSTTSLQIIVNENSNPAGTTYAVYDTVNAKYVIAATGGEQAGEDWQTYANWGSGAGKPHSPPLGINTQHTYQVKARAPDGVTVSLGPFGPSTSKYTLANVPTAPTVNVVGSSSLKIIINANSNPAATEFAISCDTDTTFLNYTTNACEAIVNDANHWRTYANWGGASGFTDTGLLPLSSHTYKVEARNGDNTATALSGGTSQTTTDTFTWDGGGATNNWSEAANWTDDAIPGVSDTAKFTNLSTKLSTIDAGAGFGGTIAGINIGSGYAGGTITAARDLTVSGNFTLAGGIFNTASQTINVGGNWDSTGGALSSTGTVNFNAGTTGKTITAAGAHFYNLTFNGAGGGWTLQDATYVDFDLTLTNGTLNMGSVTTTVSRFAILDGGGSLTAGSSTLVMNGATGRIYGGNQTLNNVTISGSAVTVRIYSSNVIISGTLTVNDGETLSIDSSRAITMNNNSTTTINGTGAISGSGSIYFYDSANANLSTGGTLNPTYTGMFASALSSITIPARTYGGPVTVANYNSSADASAVFGTAGGQTLTFQSNLTLYTATTKTLTADVSVYNPTVNITGNFTCSKLYSAVSTIKMGSGTWTVSGNVNFTNGTVTVPAAPTTATLKMDGASKILTPNANTLNHFEAAGSTSLGGDLSLNGNLTIDSGKTLNTSVSNYNISLKGDWTNNATTSAFTANGSTVNLTGAGGSIQTISGSTTFNNLSATGSSARTIKYTDGTTQTVGGTWTMTGAAGQLITLARTGVASAWTINPTAASVSYANISWSNNNGVSFCATNSTDSGNNGGTTGWKISDAAACVAPTVATPTITNNNAGTSVTFNGNIINTGGANSTERGFKVYDGADITCTGAVLQNPKENGSYGTGAYSIGSGAVLTAGTQYYYISYAINPFGTTASSCETFTTPTIPTTTVSAATSVSSVAATLNGDITSTGIGTPASGVTVTERGFRVYTNLTCDSAILQNPHENDYGAGYSTGAFSIATTDALSPHTDYWYKSYAINSYSGTAGVSTACQQFTTIDTTITMSVQAATSITETGATLNGTIVSIVGGSNTAERGFKLYENSAVCAGTPTSISEAGSYGTGAYPLSAGVLLPNINYSYKSYAVNSADTEEFSPTCETFVTLAATPSAMTVSAQSWDGTGNPFSVTVNANGNPAATAYYIQGKEIAASDPDPQGTCNTSDTWFQIGGGDGWATHTVAFTDYRTADAYVCYRIKARNASLSETTYSSTSVVAQAAPAQPTFQAAVATYAPTITTSSITWDWNDNSVALTGYRLYNSATNDEVCSAAAPSGCTQTQSSPGNNLQPNVSYSVKAEAYRGAIKGQPSATVSAYTAIEPASGVTWGTFTTTSLSGTPSNTPSNLTAGTSGIQYKTYKVSDNSLIDTSAWQQNTNSFTPAPALDINTQYRYEIQSRNGDSRTTTAQTAQKYTRANAPVTPSHSAIATDSITWNWNKNSNPAWTEFYASDDSGANSGWVADTGSWNSTVPAKTPNTQFTATILARNGDSIDTTTIQASAYTAIQTPTTITAGLITPNSIALNMTDSLTNLNVGSSGIQFAETSGNQNGGGETAFTTWPQTTGTTDTGLKGATSGVTGTTYRYKVKARNAEGVETTTFSPEFEFTTTAGTQLLFQLPGETLDENGGTHLLSYSDPTPNQIIAGVPFNLTIDAADGSNYRDLAHQDTITLSSTDSQAVFPASAAMTSGGITYNNVVMKTVGAQTISGSGSAGSSHEFVVVPGVCSATVSTATAVPNSLNTGQTSTITVYLKDVFGNALAGHSVSAGSDQAGDNITFSAATTDVNGRIYVYVTSATAHISTITVSDTTDAVTLDAHPQITFNSLPLAEPPSTPTPAPATPTPGTTAILTSTSPPIPVPGESPKGDTEAPTVPSNLRAIDIGTTTLTIAWDASTDNVGVTGYAIYNAYTSILVGTTANTRFSFTNLTPDTSYSFYVKAYDRAGNYSNSSGTLSIRTHKPTSDEEQQIIQEGGIVSYLVIGNLPKEISAGANFPDKVRVTAADAGGKIITTYDKPVYFSSTDQNAKFDFNNKHPYTFTAEDAGIHEFNGSGFVLNTAGKQKVIVSDYSVSASGEVNVISGTEVFQKAGEKLQNFFANPDNVTKVNTGVVTTTAAILLTPFLISTALSLGSLLPQIIYWLTQLLQVFGIRKRRKPWGIVFNSQTGQPIPLAMVRIYDKKYNRMLEQSIADNQGRYGFLTKEGAFYIVVVKSGFIFPSKSKLSSFYERVYTGSEFKIAGKDQTVSFNIPLDPHTKASVTISLWIGLVKINRFLQKLRLPILIIGFIFSLVMIILAYQLLYVFALIFYILIGILEYLRTRKSRPYGIVTDIFNHPLEMTIVRIFEKKNNRLIETDVTDQDGRFKFMVNPGVYYLTAVKPGFIDFKSHLMYLQKEQTLVSTTIKLKKEEK